MSDLFDDEVDLSDDVVSTDDNTLSLDASEITILDARRRLEKMLEDRRLREELDDFVDY